MPSQFAQNQPSGFKNHLEKIAIVGAGGQIGQWITTALLQNKSLKVTAITREGSLSNIPFDIPTIKADYDDRASLVNALKGQDCLIVTMSVMAPPDSTKALYEAAAEAGVPWVVPNEYGGDASNAEANKDMILGPRKAQERKIITDAGVSSWVGIACGFWYEFSLGGGTSRYGFDFPNKTIKWFSEGDVNLCTSTFPQVARALATVLSLKVLPDNESDKSLTLDSFRNDFVRIASFCVSQKDMWESVLRVTGDKAEDWTQSTVDIHEWYADGMARFQKGDMTGFGQLLYARVFYPDAPGDMSDRLDNQKLGLPTEDLDDFTRKAVEIGTTGYHANQYKIMYAELEKSKEKGKEGHYMKLMNDHNEKQ